MQAADTAALRHFCWRQYRGGWRHLIPGLLRLRSVTHTLTPQDGGGGLTTSMGGLLEAPVVVVGNSLHQVHLGAGDAADGPVPVVSNPHVQVAGVEVLKVLVEGDKFLQGGTRTKRKLVTVVERTGHLSTLIANHFISRLHQSAFSHFPKSDCYYLEKRTTC